MCMSSGRTRPGSSCWGGTLTEVASPGMSAGPRQEALGSGQALVGIGPAERLSNKGGLHCHLEVLGTDGPGACLWTPSSGSPIFTLGPAPLWTLYQSHRQHQCFQVTRSKACCFGWQGWSGPWGGLSRNAKVSPSCLVSGSLPPRPHWIAQPWGAG